ncbi:MAG: hypothetical protein VKQ33_04025 [Candidatus Sericytochromatia bacterium]|nr:hypothetical protein [Candidatus Sericytochromatia bacterium]
MAKENTQPVVPPHTVRHVDGVMHLQLHVEATRNAPSSAPSTVPAREERSL